MGTFVTIYLFVVALTSEPFIQILLLLTAGILASVLFKRINSRRRKHVSSIGEQQIQEVINFINTPQDEDVKLYNSMLDSVCKGTNCQSTPKNYGHSDECLEHHDKVTAVIREQQIRGYTDEQIAENIRDTFATFFPEFDSEFSNKLNEYKPSEYEKALLKHLERRSGSKLPDREELTNTFYVDLQSATAIIGELVDQLKGEIPEKNCTCFLSPPCGNCVSYGLIYETIDDAKKFLKEQKVKQLYRN